MSNAEMDPRMLYCLERLAPTLEDMEKGIRPECSPMSLIELTAHARGGDGPFYKQDVIRRIVSQMEMDMVEYSALDDILTAGSYAALKPATLAVLNGEGRPEDASIREIIGTFGLIFKENDEDASPRVTHEAHIRERNELLAELLKLKEEKRRMEDEIKHLRAKVGAIRKAIDDF